MPLRHHCGASFLLGVATFPSSSFLLPESCITQFFVLAEFSITWLSVLANFSVPQLLVLAGFSVTKLSMLADFFVPRLSMLAKFSATRLSVLTTRLEPHIFCSVLPTRLTRLEFADFGLLSQLPWLTRVTQSAW
jgi:hypothetical protein